MKTNGRTIFALLLAGALLSACASTKLVNTWRDSRYTGPPLTKILVIGVTKQSVMRRIYEDSFAQQLRAHGVEAVPSYTLIPEDGEVSKERLAQAIDQSGTEGVLITRLVQVKREARVYPGTYWGPPYVGFYGFYNWAWAGFYEPPQVVTYDVVTWDTSLFDAKTNDMLWAGTTETFSPEDLRKQAREFAQVVVKALAKEGLIPK